MTEIQIEQPKIEPIPIIQIEQLEIEPIPIIQIEQLERKPIPMWKWILLHFCPTHIGFDSEGEVACVSFAKVLFKQIYFMRTDYYSMTTGNLLKTNKLTRKG